MRTAAVDADRAVQSRAALGLVLTIVFGVTPSLFSGMLMLQGIGVKGNLAEPGIEVYAHSIAIAAFSPLVLAMIPGYPLSMSVVFDKRIAKLLNALTAAGTALLALPAVELVINGSEFKGSALKLAPISIALGSAGFALILSAMFTSRVDASVEEMLNHVRVWRSLHLYRSSALEREERRGARLWTADYLAEALGFFRQVGDCEPAVFELLAMYVHECKRSAKKCLQTLAVMLAVVVISPAMNASMLSLGARAFPQHILLGYLSSVAYGFIASKAALGESKSTLLPALSALIFALVAPA
ncbi:MAG: hypothetical protein QXW94_01370 [Desulfurococcaceae archaeon]